MAKIKIEQDLYIKVKQIAKSAGYSSVDEYVSHLIEKEIDCFETGDIDEDVAERLKGLGYIS